MLGIAYRELGAGQRIAREDESSMVFLGFIVLSDPPKAGVVKTIRELGELGVRLKIITGDNSLIAAHVAREVGLDNVRILSGSEMHQMSICFIPALGLRVPNKRANRYR